MPPNGYPRPASQDDLRLPLPKGYHKLAAFMGKSRRMSIFRRFGRLTMLNLLSLQAELVELEVQFRDICTEDDESPDSDEQNFSSYFHALRNSEGTTNDEQWQMMLTIRKKLHEYHTALLQAADLSKLDRAPKDGLNTLKDWLRTESQGNRFLQGSEAFTWDDEADLFTVYDYKGQQDPTPAWLKSTALTWMPRLLYDSNKRGGKVDEETGAILYDIDNQRVDMIGTTIAAVVSSVLPLVAIMVLYFVKSTIQRLGIAIVFTTIFAAALTLFTTARRIEIFAGTASFAAVEVVFIGSVN